jgi:hypothetical protein
VAFKSLGREPCRLNVNYPPTAVGGIWTFCAKLID